MARIASDDEVLLEEHAPLRAPLVSVLSGEEFTQTARKRPRPAFHQRSIRPEKDAPTARSAHSHATALPRNFRVEPFVPSYEASGIEPDGVRTDSRTEHRTESGGSRAATHSPAFHIRLPRALALAGGIGLAIIALAAAMILSSHAVFPSSARNLVLPNEDSIQEALMAIIEPDPPEHQENVPLPPLPPVLAERTYTVRRGDSLQSIARRFGLREDTIIAANNLRSQDQLRSGLVLKIPNMNGIYHSVRRNENLSTIARAYGVTIEQIADINNISSANIQAGQRLFIPNARLSSSIMSSFYGTTFIWPARGPISSPFGYRSNPFSGTRTFHSAIDIVLHRGTPVKATRAGTVADTGYNAVFGNYVILRHGEGYQSLYAHLDQILVKKGAEVAQGTLIGHSGNTGQSTGPHLHFSLFRNGQALDPLKVLR
ncbi:MAG: M23 family metallopeptidase [Rectinemataceae bacterium]